MSLFQILVLFGLGIAVYILFQLIKVLGKIEDRVPWYLGSINVAEKERISGNVLYEIERHLFAIRSHLPIVDIEDEQRFETLKDTKEEGWIETIDLVYDSIDEIKKLLESINDKLIIRKEVTH